MINKLVLENYKSINKDLLPTIENLNWINIFTGNSGVGKTNLINTILITNPTFKIFGYQFTFYGDIPNWLGEIKNKLEEELNIKMVFNENPRLNQFDISFTINDKFLPISDLPSNYKYLILYLKYIQYNDLIILDDFINNLSSEFISFIFIKIKEMKNKQYIITTNEQIIINQFLENFNSDIINIYKLKLQSIKNNKWTLIEKI